MLKKEIKKIVGLKKEDFNQFITDNQVQLQSARLIPVLKTGDEMALSSIFLSTLKLVKEYRQSLFKELKLGKGGKVYYYTEVCFPKISKSRFDGLIIVVKKGIIVDAVVFEMKNKNNGLSKEQIERYLELSKKLKIDKLVTISNEFVADPSHSPIKIKVAKNMSLLHFSWTYLITKGQLLLFKNDYNIQDEDQVEIMREVLYYFENKDSGIRGYTQMKNGWKVLADNVKTQKPLKEKDEYIEEAVLSWYEEEKDMALLLSRKLGVLVKSSIKNKESLKKDIKRLVKENYISGLLSIKNSVSDIKVIAEFERRIVSMSVKVIPPLNKGTIAKISWIAKQLDNCKKKTVDCFKALESDILIEANIKYAQKNLIVRLSELNTLNEIAKGKEIQAFNIVVSKDFGAKFANNKQFIVLIEQLVLNYYEGIVQHITNWNRPAPKLEHN